MKKGLYISLIALVLILGGLLTYFLIKKDDFPSKIKKNNPEIEKLVSIKQAEISSFIFVTQESSNNHVINLNLTPFLTFEINDKEIKSFDISNFEATNTGGNEVILIHPTDLPINTVSRTFLFTKQDDIKQKDLIKTENNIEYKVVSKVEKFNEVSNKGSISPSFGIIVKDIASVDYQAIFQRDGVFEGSKYLEYSKIPLSNLNTNIQFDINIEFTDGKKYSKRFTSEIKGESFKTETAPIFPIKSEE